MMNTKEIKRFVILNIPYVIVGLLATNLGEAWRLAAGTDISEKILALLEQFRRHSGIRFRVCILLICAWDWCAEPLRTAVYLRGKNAKKYRQMWSTGSARWERRRHQAFMDRSLRITSSLTQTER